jgi:hypothetical protein
MGHHILGVSQEGRASSAPPVLPHLGQSPSAPSSPHPMRKTGNVLSQKENILAAHLDIMPNLQRSTPSVVKSRNGSVLSRGSILKTDHYPSGKLCFRI